MSSFSLQRLRTGQKVIGSFHSSVLDEHHCIVPSCCEDLAGGGANGNANNYTDNTPPAAVLFACLITFGFGNLEEPKNR